MTGIMILATGYLSLNLNPGKSIILLEKIRNIPVDLRHSHCSAHIYSSAPSLTTEPSTPFTKAGDLSVP